MVLWEIILTEKSELVQLTDRLSKEDRVRQKLWDKLIEEGKTDKEIVKIFINFGF